MIPSRSFTMKQVMDFLRELSLNNEKPWFEAHKQEYLLAKATVSSLTLKLLEGIHEFDDTIGPLTVSDCTYRIYRDLRFSKDKSPYKTHMGIFITRGGKKSGYSGYYFHIDGSGNHLIAIGNYYTEPRVLKTLREDIELGGGDFRRIIEGLDPCLELETEGSLKNVPKGFPADSPDAGFLKLKSFCLVGYPDDKFMLDPGLAGRLVSIFKTGKPFLDYVNRAIDYCREEKKEYFSSLDF